MVSAAEFRSTPLSVYKMEIDFQILPDIMSMKAGRKTAYQIRGDV